MARMLPQDNRSGQAPPPRLLVDAMLGRLARWLRLMGYDTAYWARGSDDELIRAARAEERLIITRDRQLAGRRAVHALLIDSETLDEQITEVRRFLGDDPALFSRCAECNAPLVDLPREEARSLVPPYVWQTQATFKHCTGCGRVYWRGTHWPGMQDRLREDEG